MRNAEPDGPEGPGETGPDRGPAPANADAVTVGALHRVHRMLEGITDGFLAIDRAWRVTCVNRAALRILGQAETDLLGRVFREVFPGLAGSPFEEVHRRAMDEGTGGSAVGWYPDHARWYEVSAHPAPDGISILFRDVTAQQDTLRALRESEAMLNTVLDSLPVSVVIVDARGGVIRTNAAHHELWGTTPRTTSMEQYGEWVGWWPATGERIAAHEWPMARVLRDGETVRGELVECRPFDGGAHRFYLSHAAPIRHASGHLLGGVLIEVDVSGKRAADMALESRTRELAESRERLDIALAAGGMGVWDWNLATGESHWNEQMYALLGLTADADGRSRGDRFLAMVHPEDRSRLDASIGRALGECTEFVDEFRLLRADGETRWLAARGRVICGPDGRPERMTGINFDITERRNIEQKLREVDARRNEFLAMLAHELRNPLAPLANAVKLFERMPQVDARQATVTQILKRQVQQMSRLVDDLLEVSRVIQGRIELRKENVLAATAILSAAETVRPLMREQDQSLEIDVPTGIDLVADPTRLVQIMANLLNNAAKYTPPGGKVAVRARADEDGHVEIVVSDNGVGLDADLLPRVFDLFSQGATTLDRSRGGLGIGLSLVKRLVELHGGRIEASSPGPGRGSTFTLRLPRADRRMVGRGVAAGLPGRRLAPTAILVVDDNHDAAESLALLLEADGHRVRRVHDGAAVLDAARGFAPRAVLLDLALPGMDGFQVARALRADPELSGVAIVALSGFGQAADRVRSREAGCDAHLLKPVDLDEVYRTLAEVLDAR